MDIDISIAPTPNPNALKFVVNHPVILDGRKATVRTEEEAGTIPLAKELFSLRGVDQLHFFGSAITITKFSFEYWENLEPKVLETILKAFPEHNIDFEIEDPETIRRRNLPEELVQIEEILDRRIRPGLQADGGDLQCVDFNKTDHVLLIKYEGACGTCPSSSMGTLEAIRGILQDEYDPEIEVYIAPEY